MLILPFPATAKTFNIYIDADRTHNREAGLAIERGLRTALAEVNYKVSGHTLKVVPLDHRGNTVRSRKNLRWFLEDPNSLVVFGGMHSPPLIKNRSFINDNKILTLVPWAAATPITRPKDENNWIFRLSLDDSKVGNILVQHALKNKCNSPHLLLEDTGWGKANFKTMTKALKNNKKTPSGTTWFGWNISDASARTLMRNIIYTNSDCILFVGNTPEGITLTRALLNTKNIPKLISHWGITGGKYAEMISHDDRNLLNLSFIQSCFTFTNNTSDIALKVMTKAQNEFSDIKEARDIKAPAGFIHSYDLAKILIHSMNNIDLENNIQVIQQKIKETLENLESPTKGLLKEYKQPFSKYSITNIDAHEALNKDDFCMAEYNINNEIVILND